MLKKILYITLNLLLCLCFSLSALADSYIPNPAESDNSASIAGIGSPGISAYSAVLMDAKSGVIIYSKDINSHYYPASITKIMTALLAIENSKNDYNQRVEFSHNAVFSVAHGDSHIAMHEDESLSLEECLMGLMLASANEVANALAEHFADTNDNFAEMMNKRAAELGAVNTHFINPHGSHNENHYTTALDMAYIMKEAIRHPKFLEVITTKSLKLPPTLKQPEERPLNNSHKMIHPNHSQYYEYVIGGKTGFTDQAGNTLVTYAEKDNMSLIAVILYGASSAAAYEDTQALFEYGFSTFSDVTIFSAANFSEKINIIETKDGQTIDSGIIGVYAKDDVSMYLPSTISPSGIKRELDMPYQMEPPVEKDQKIGTVKFTYMGNELAKVDLFAAEASSAPVISASSATPLGGTNGKSVSPDGGLNIFLKFAIAIFSVLFAVLVIFIISERRRRKKKRRQAQLRREKLAGRRPSKETRPGNYKYKGNDITGR